ncbi:eukaryotic translation initiation factor 4E-binding protein 2-like isoform X2 [Oncorhynchus masou masou]|uniref:eukaryotic translation initiation factor 4E-binding protein 2-like isoform X2 n=1 Tax=Oncorhynchus masou masou TaxID=90313 RepID=UPI0031846A4E
MQYNQRVIIDMMVYQFFKAGTRIIYDRKFLLDRRNSPIAQTPPAHLPIIPGVTSLNVLTENRRNEANNHIKPHNSHGKTATGEDAQFEMDI